MKKTAVFLVTAWLLALSGCGTPVSWQESALSNEESAAETQEEPEDTFAIMKKGEIGDVAYSIVHYNGEDYARIDGYTGAEETVVLPEEIEGYPVKTICAYCFAWNETLRSVTMPESIEEIYLYSFYGCTALEEVVLPDQYIYISGSAFRDTPYIEGQFDENGLFIRYGLLVSGGQAEGDVVLSEEILEIADYAFEGNPNLFSVVLPVGLKRIESGMFCNCERLESVTIPEGVELIKDNAFHNCVQLKEIVLPESVTEIQYEAFSNSGLETINIANVSVIGENAFGGTPWAASQE